MDGNILDTGAAMIIPLASDQATLENCGGKGMNLSRLARAGLPVPDGILVTTAAYQAFVDYNDLPPAILAVSGHLDITAPAALEEASRTLRTLFSHGRIPQHLAQQLLQAYQAMGQPPVAVRSSATAEDLPDFSFAGQQDTYLNVQGADALLKAVVDCWSSLWTARAIGYRARALISPGEMQLAVVVQKMIPCQASGVLFTANPLTEKRSEIVIDATLGLGEALVSGLVEPDHYTVENDVITARQLGAKAISIRAVQGGGTLRQDEQAANLQALPDEEILALSRLARQVENLFGSPQDIEWGWADGTLYLLQSRPITTLYPAIRDFPAHHDLRVLYSFGAIQGVMQPITPLGRDFFDLLIRMMVRVFDHKEITQQTVLYEAGERLFADGTSVFFHRPFGRKAGKYIFSLVEPGTQEIMQRLLQDPRLAVKPAKAGISPGLRRVLLQMAPTVLRNLLFPVFGRRRLQKKIEKLVASVSAELDACQNLAESLPAIEQSVMRLLKFGARELVPAVASGQVPLQLLRRALPANSNVWQLTRGLSYNVTTEMDLALWATSRAIRLDYASYSWFQQRPIESLVQDALDGQLPAIAQHALDVFMQKYGMRGMAEIDIGRPRWQENPTPILHSLCSYLQMEDSPAAPDRVFEASMASAEAALQAYITSERQRPGGWLRALRIKILGRRVRELTGLRETPKYTLIRCFTRIRQALLRSGQMLVANGRLDQADDVFFFGFAELKQLSTGTPRNWKSLVRLRRQSLEHEQGRRRVPRVLLSDGTAFYEGVATPQGEDASVIMGSPVSSGVVQGKARVVLNPLAASLTPGEILVCPGTDPSWTPLFLSAGGLVMEVGGMMTHGAVVAREYGIPAVVGISHITELIHTGDLIQVDGSSGRVIILQSSQS